jgi:hypothetical protein
MGIMRLAVALVMCSLVVRAQVPPAAPPEKPVLQNLGKPMHIEFKCADDDMLSAGMSCSEEDPCPVYLELSAAEAVGNRLFAAGNIHSAQATLYSILLASDDGGKTWSEPFERLRASSLDRIQFTDFEAGWVAGQVLQPLPNDPFFLVTTDGGKTWRRRPIFSESRAGAVQQFWFDSRSTGTLLITDGPRHELYESPNGGETWLVREVSDRPIRWNQRLPGSASVRIRADASTKSFRIERQQSERWNSVASFLIAAGACKPAAPELTPPPEPEAEPEQAQPAVPPRRPAKPPTLRRPPK